MVVAIVLELVVCRGVEEGDKRNGSEGLTEAATTLGEGFVALSEVNANNERVLHPFDCV